MDCYVYYRVSGAHADAARLAVTQLFALTATRFGVVGRLQRRADASSNDIANDSATWMERYDDVGPAFVPALAQMATECGVAALADGGRHVECFVDIPSSPHPCA
ncbi:hypothetical protein AB870_00710 [Pandoraea faecigallinarum]|uniref:DUF4936 domain-containing protein n=1 Tax=Pandoraea faecigallinarum TaxID=656179 RepID=A0A0H3WMN0_9BURK|nr:DUF4936 family protein [Pandoraea faecigallinarum]AKM28967.1 hypothetical protein AB870_00710 [Pandoraea faecigallinarum]